MNLQKLTEDFKKKKKAFVAKAAKSFEKEVLALARTIEGLEEIRWQQYTPYFNDGESCVFGVSDPGFKFTNTPEGAGDYGDGFEDAWGINYHRKENGLGEHPDTAKLNKVAKLICSEDLEDILEDLYGDHVEITVNVKTGKFEVEEHDHD
jgi:hypothetical protein